MQADPFAECVVGDVENVIRLVVGLGDLEDVEMSIDGVHEAELASHEVDGADAAVSNAASPVGDFVMNVGRSEHRLLGTAEIGLIEPLLDPSLAVGQFGEYFGSHSKSLRG